MQEKKTVLRTQGNKMEGNGGEAEVMKEGRRSALAVNVAFEEAPYRLQSSSDETHLTDMREEWKGFKVCLSVCTCM